MKWLTNNYSNGAMNPDSTATLSDKLPRSDARLKRRHRPPPSGAAKNSTPQSIIPLKPHHFDLTESFFWSNGTTSMMF